jgi:(5-formylfuran-3-yl)methyl phosphate synthase
MYPQLLVSVRDLPEFQLAISSGVQWIDLKNPDRGSLGRPDLELTNQVIQTIRNTQFRNFRTSIALGELKDLELNSIEPGIAEFDFAKVALAQCEANSLQFEKISQLASQFSSSNRLILVHYADWFSVGAPSFERVLDWARQLGSQFILIDTCRKSSGNLRSLYSLKTLHEIVAQTHQAGISISLAGSLSVLDLMELAPYNPDVLAVRGAACTVGLRTNGLCEDRLRQLLQLSQLGFVDRSLCTTDVQLQE